MSAGAPGSPTEWLEALAARLTFGNLPRWVRIALIVMGCVGAAALAILMPGESQWLRVGVLLFAGSFLWKWRSAKPLGLRDGLICMGLLGLGYAAYVVGVVVAGDRIGMAILLGLPALAILIGVVKGIRSRRRKQGRSAP